MDLAQAPEGRPSAARPGLARFIPAARLPAVCAELRARRFLVAGATPTPLTRGRLRDAIDEAVEGALAMRGGLPPCASADVEIEPSIRDQLLRAKAIGLCGIAVALPRLDGAAGERGELDASDGTALAAWMDAVRQGPIVLLLDEADRGVCVSTPVPLSKLVPEPPLSARPAARPAVKVEEPPVKVEERAAKAGEPAPKVEQAAPKVEQAAPKVEQAAPKVEQPAPKVEQASLKVEQAAPKVEQLAPKVEQLAPKVEQPSPKVEQSSLKVEQFAPKVEELAPKVEQSSLKVEESAPKVDSTPVAAAALEPTPLAPPIRVDPSRVVAAMPRVLVDTPPVMVEAPPVMVEAPPVIAAEPPARQRAPRPPQAPPSAQEKQAREIRNEQILGAAERRSFAMELDAAKGPKPARVIDQLFTTRYVPLLRAVCCGEADATVRGVVEAWRTSFEHSYRDSYASMRVTAKRPPMVFDAPDIAAKIGRMNAARAVRLVLVDSMSFELGERVMARLKGHASGRAALVDRSLLWASLPTTTSQQLSLLARGAEGLRDAPVVTDPEAEIARGRAVSTLRRERLGVREVMKLDCVEARLRNAGAPYEERLDGIADEVAQVVSRFMDTLQPRTLLYIFGDHGFRLVQSSDGASTGPATQGGASPEEVLVPGYSWLAGGVH